MTAVGLPGIGPGGRPRRELAPGAVHVPSWLMAGQQRWIAGRFHEWTRGPVPIRAAKVGGHEMSVQTVCLGWHWQPYKYTRVATDVNGERVLPFPGWMVRLGRLALAPRAWSTMASPRSIPGPPRKTAVSVRAASTSPCVSPASTDPVPAIEGSIHA